MTFSKSLRNLKSSRKLKSWCTELCFEMKACLISSLLYSANKTMKTVVGLCFSNFVKSFNSDEKSIFAC